MRERAAGILAAFLFSIAENPSLRALDDDTGYEITLITTGAAFLLFDT
ncbi:MAG: hypothetical protein ACE5DW_06620 [Thermodesulfobacteriota bacterium]